MADDDSKRLHETITFLGLRAQATAVGMIQTAIELRRAGVLDDAAVGRIRDAIFRDLALSCPRSQSRSVYEESLRRRLDALFADTERVGSEAESVLGTGTVAPTMGLE